MKFLPSTLFALYEINLEKIFSQFSQLNNYSRETEEQYTIYNFKNRAIRLTKLSIFILKYYFSSPKWAFPNFHN